MAIRSRSSRRIITRVIVFLLLGAIVNVTVAWSIGLWCDETSAEFTRAENVLNSAFGTQMSFNYMSMASRGSGSFVGRCVAMGAATGAEPRIYSVHEVWAGFPIPSMRGQRLAIDGEAWGSWSVMLSENAINRLGAFRASTLPLRPIWPGFAINTLFYAAILWLLFAAAFALRRRRRIKRGLCPKCAYPIGASVVCTECGATVQSSARTT